MPKQNMSSENLAVEVKRIGLELVARAEEIDAAVVVWLTKGENGGVHGVAIGRDKVLPWLVCLAGSTVAHEAGAGMPIDMTSRDN